MHPTIDPAWETIHSQREWGRTPNEHLCRFVKRTFTDSSDRAFRREHYLAIDVGCGIGAQSQWLASEGFDVLAVDGSVSAIRRAEQILPYYNFQHVKKVTFKVGDVRDLGIVFGAKPGTVDLITDVACWQHLQYRDRYAAMREARNMLKPGGYVFSLTLRTGTSKSIIDAIRTFPLAYNQMTGLFAQFFTIVSVDREDRTDHDGKIKIRNWIVVARKDGGQ